MKLLPLLFLLPAISFADTTVSNSVPVTANTGVDARNQSTNNGSDLSRSVGMAVAPSLTTTFSETSTL